MCSGMDANNNVYSRINLIFVGAFDPKRLSGTTIYEAWR